MNDMLKIIRTNVVQGRLDSEDEGLEGDMEGQPGVLDLVAQALAQGVPSGDILSQGLTAGMELVGQRYEAGEFLIPDMLAAAECVAEAVKILEPHLSADDHPSRGTFVIATVEGDLHDIGKNIVATLLRGAGYTVEDLGTGVPAPRIVEAVQRTGADYLGLSALLTTTMPHMKETVDLLCERGMRKDVQILIGGAPTSAEFAKQIGADAHCRDAFDALHRMASPAGGPHAEDQN